MVFPNELQSLHSDTVGAAKPKKKKIKKKSMCLDYGWIRRYIGIREVWLSARLENQKLYSVHGAIYDGVMGMK